MAALSKKGILITGCSSGIGECLAQGLHRRGYRVFATARRHDDVAALSAQGLESLQLDLDSTESINRCVDTILERADGRLYGLINNGAYSQPGAVEDLSRDTLRRQFETNLFGTQELTNRVIPIFRKQARGRVVQISSMLGYVCLAYRGAYNASKYALEALTDTLRLELRDTNIHLSLIEPGPIRSRFRANALAAYRAHIDALNSAHREVYPALEKRLGDDRDAPFTLPPTAVLPKVVHALESARPRIRYRVTVPAHLTARFKRVLPDIWMDRFLHAGSGSKQD